MNYSILATQPDESGHNARVNKHPREYPIKKYKFLKGIPLLSKMTEDLKYKFSDEKPEGRILNDLIENSLRLLIVSKRVKKILEVEKNIEFLPVILLNHRDKIASNDYTIANILNHVDCIDTEKSELVMSSLDPERVQRIKKLVLNESKIPEGINIFRLANSPTTVLVSLELKKRIEAEGIEGPLFVPIEEFDSAYFLGV